MNQPEVLLLRRDWEQGKSAVVEQALVLDAVAQRLGVVKVAHPQRVGVDEMCGAGKTPFRPALAN